MIHALLLNITIILSRLKFGFNKEDIKDLLTQIKAQGSLIIAKPLKLDLIDSEDLKFIEVALGLVVNLNILLLGI